jgi:Putative prokaryotic signal transducing protein
MSDRPDPNEQLVKIFDGEQESEALVVRGLLESAGIDSMMTAIDTDQELFPMGGVRILVREDQAEEARRLIEEHRAAAANDPDVSEPPE